MLCDTAGSKEPRLSKNVPGKLGWNLPQLSPF
jgi:hypothetical protein